MAIYKFTNLNTQDPEEIQGINFSRKGGKEEISSLHSLSSYLAMFAPALPEFFINLYSKEGDLIMDPFSGRGTTALRARELNRKFVGGDLNPYAYALTNSKIQNADLEKTIQIIKNLKIQYILKKNEFLKEAGKKEYSTLRIYYSKGVLSQLIFIRENLGKNYLTLKNEYSYLLGVILGLMHGPQRQAGDSIYFSLDMPNTISMSPNYVKKFAKEKKLKKPVGDIFEKIINRAKKKYDKLLLNSFESDFKLRSAIDEYSNLPNESVKLVVTSPPYLSIVNYTNSNWLKLWMLGFEREKLKDIGLSDSLNKKQYEQFIINVLNNIYDKVQTGGLVCLIVGDVHEERLIENIWSDIEFMVRFRFKEIYYDESYLQTRKVTNMLNKRKGEATIIEKILVLEK